MADYWESGTAAPGTETAAPVQPAASGDAMVDDVLVSNIGLNWPGSTLTIA